MTGYTAFDMMMYNRQRKAEFLAAQRKMQADSLEAARLAYMTGKATEEQVLLVEEANEREERAATRIFKLPALLGAPTPLDDKPAVEQQPPPPPPPPPPKVSDVATWPGAADAGTRPEQKPGGIFAWFSTRPRQAEQTTDAAGDTRPRSSGQVDETSGIPGSSGLAQAAGEKQQQAYVRTKAREAFEQEKQNQRTGGPLDRVGLDDGDQSQTSKKKKGWLW